jgi:hypothetical protein
MRHLLPSRLGYVTLGSFTVCLDCTAHVGFTVRLGCTAHVGSADPFSRLNALGRAFKRFGDSQLLERESWCVSKQAFDVLDEAAVPQLRRKSRLLDDLVEIRRLIDERYVRELGVGADDGRQVALADLHALATR